MKKNIVIAVMALIIVGGGGFMAGEKLGGKNVAPETTTEGTTVATVKEAAPETTERATEAPAPVAERVVVTEKIVYVTEKQTETEAEAPKPTEKATEATTKANKTEKTAETTKNSAEKISREKAKSIALSHAGLNEADVRGLEIELDNEKGVLVYEVSFESGKYEYDYDIDAYTGAIKYSEKDFDD